MGVFTMVTVRSGDKLSREASPGPPSCYSCQENGWPKIKAGQRQRLAEEKGRPKRKAGQSEWLAERERTAKKKGWPKQRRPENRLEMGYGLSHGNGTKTGTVTQTDLYLDFSKMGHGNVKGPKPGHNWSGQRKSRYCASAWDIAGSGLSDLRA